MNEPKVLILVGPTAVGKTALSLDLAEQLNAEMVSADSRQVYKFMDVGTAKPTPEELERIPHHFIDIRFPDQLYSAGEYGRDARDVIATLLSKSITPLVVGGSGFYIRALVDGLFAPHVTDPEIKEQWRQRIKMEGKEQVFAFLQKVDPETGARLHINDTQRVVRALEVWELTGKPISEFRQGEETPASFIPLFFGLNRKRDELYARIEQRVDDMISEGLVAEVENLLHMGYGPQYNALRTVGYREVFDYFEGKIDYETMIDTIKQNTRRYAKRQLTWFRKDERIFWLYPGEQSHDFIVESILNQLNRY